MRFAVCFGVGLVCSSAQLASAAVYLSGVVWYRANESGSTLSEPAEYDNIAATGNSEGKINGTARGTTFLLSEGANAFSYSGVGSGYNGFSLYFSPDSSPFSRAFASAPDLVTFGGTSPLTPTAGAAVQTNGQFSGTAAYAGNNSFTIGDQIITVTALGAGGSTGTFTITVTTVPTPAGAAVLAGAGLFAVRRRRSL